MQLLIDAGANINATNNDGETALIFTINRYYNLQGVQVLIENGANLYAKNKQGLTALDIARKKLQEIAKDKEFPMLQKAVNEIIELLEDAMKK